MFKLVGMLAAALGLGIMSMARSGEGIGSALFFLLGLALFAFGLYLVFFEDGMGAARWLPFLRP